MREEMISNMKKYQKQPSPENKDVFEASHKNYLAYAKTKPERSIKINFNEWIPNGFWRDKYEFMKWAKQQDVKE